MKVSVSKSRDAWRTAPWTVRYYENRKAKRKFFATKEEAEQHAREVRQTLRSGVHPADMSEAHRLIAGTGHNLPNIVQVGLQFLRETNAERLSPTATFSDGIACVLENAKGCRKKTVRGYRYVFSLLERSFGDRIANTITAREVQMYLDSLPDRKGTKGNASPYTRETMFRYIRMALRALGISNPLPSVKVPLPLSREIQFFSTEEIVTILSAARHSERGMVALATFAAIRPETLERLPPECVNVADKIIRIPGELSKDHRAHCLETVPLGNDREVRPGPPEVLWGWLRRHPFRPQSWSSVQRRLYRALGNRWVQDGLRHSGATYYRAKYGDAATAELLTHASIAMVNQHYAGLATRAQAEAFLALSVDSVPPPPPEVVRQKKDLIWPSDHELAEMLIAAPASLIAKSLGCSDSMIAKRCRKRGIPKPGRGSWSAKPS